MKVGDLIRGTNGFGLGLIIEIKSGKIVQWKLGQPVVDKTAVPCHDLIYKVQFLKDGEWHWLTPAYLEVINESR